MTHPLPAEVPAEGYGPSAFVGPTGRTIRISPSGFTSLLDRIDAKRINGLPLHTLRGHWAEEPPTPAEPCGAVALTIDLVEARHLQQFFGEQDGEVMKAISRAFGTPPRPWAAYGYHPGCAGLSASHNREHTSY